MEPAAAHVWFHNMVISWRMAAIDGKARHSSNRFSTLPAPVVIVACGRIMARADAAGYHFDGRFVHCHIPPGRGRYRPENLAKSVALQHATAQGFQLAVVGRISSEWGVPWPAR